MTNDIEEAVAKRTWQRYCATHALPHGVPPNPDEVYANEGWRGWSDWVGRSVPAESTRLTVDVPYYVHPQALELGRVVRDMEDPQETRLVVVRIEPALICVDPEGEERMVLAHMVEVLE
jgi:hypothetical protein